MQPGKLHVPYIRHHTSAREHAGSPLEDEVDYVFWVVGSGEVVKDCPPPTYSHLTGLSCELPHDFLSTPRSLIHGLRARPYN